MLTSPADTLMLLGIAVIAVSLTLALRRRPTTRRRPLPEARELFDSYRARAREAARGSGAADAEHPDVLRRLSEIGHALDVKTVRLERLLHDLDARLDALDERESEFTAPETREASARRDAA